jgi:nucleoside-diphosphate-sugar epimerase
LLSAALAAHAKRVVLVSFPHVEGPTSPESPATGRLDRQPVSAHASTRLEEEKLLFARTERSATTPVVIRLGAVYGRGIKMIEAARWLAARRLLAVWPEPTWYQLISIPDYLTAMEAAITRPDVHGIYHVGDDRPVTIQEFLDRACAKWGYAKPRRLPFWMFDSAGALCEMGATVLRSPSPLTRDFLLIGRVSHWGDTRRARQDLIPTLRYPTLDEGLETL